MSVQPTQAYLGRTASVPTSHGLEKQGTHSHFFPSSTLSSTLPPLLGVTLNLAQLQPLLESMFNRPRAIMCNRPELGVSDSSYSCSSQGKVLS